ncbi:MAG TPA: DEAD/DEAH box helicase, partial [Gaiellaceae bacterium]|nr:DEAD/DEAH box helicase [Gaiellaceae bacterium]
MDPGASLETLPGVGPRVAQRLGRLGLRTLRDLAEHVPRAYLDWEEVGSFGDLSAGEEGTVRCTLERIRVRPTRRRNLKLVEGVVVDAAGVRETAIWFNQAYLAKLPPGTELLVHGSRELGGGFRVLRHELGGTGVHTVGLVPEYRASEDVPSQRIRSLVEDALPRLRFLPDALPARLRAGERLPLRADALLAAHRPRAHGDAEAARERLALEELLVLQLASLRRRRLAEETSALALPPEGELIARYRAALPFTLTSDQERATVEIGADLERTRPMQRLLQGDVGSGKTVVALYALLRAVEAGHQAALMAPTETLAEQHFLTVEAVCNDLGVRCELLTSSLPAAQRRAGRGRLATGEADLAVGTHALIQEDVEFRSLAVAVVDEQHRFGVEQRRALGRSTPHVLHMTATPIPRTLAQTVFGDLDVTEIARPPANRR